MNKKKRLIVGITGASGVILGIRMLEELRDTDIETHLILSPAAETTISLETGMDIREVVSLASVHYPFTDVGAAIASGSFRTLGMVIIPCSIKTLSAVANSYDDDLITRAADVTLKEGLPLLLVVREAPLHRGHIKLMDMAVRSGAIIFPPVPAFYTHPQSIDDILDNIVGRVLLRMGIENEKYQKWAGLPQK